MPKTLVIVESAAKAKTIKKYLNATDELRKYGTFDVLASFGHINDIPQKEMGVDLTTWKATYVPLAGKEKVIRELRKAVKDADHVFIASDPDLEGEAIAFHLQNELKIPKAKRITFREITKAAIKEAVLHPRGVDHDKVAAQESRRILDRVVGYELSPLLWRRFATSRLSAGRVQSAALKMLVDRATAAQKHQPTPYWELNGTFVVPATKAELQGTAHDAVWEDEADIKKVMSSINKKAWTATWKAKFEQKQSKRNPSAPFTTSTLQQEAYERLGLPAKSTMRIAQALYEHGHITYMRTDSTALSEEATQQIHAYIEEMYGAPMIQARTFKARAANAQEAHEAIRPSKMHVRKDDLGDEKDITPIHKKLYDLIWRRTIACQMAPAVYTDVIFTITSSAISQDIAFKGKYSVLVDEGYLKVYNPEMKAAPHELKAWESLLAAGETTVDAKEFEAQGSVTKPPGLYNEPQLVKALEKEGIGRPSTYATIIDKLFSKGYVMKGTGPQTTAQVNTYKTDVKSKAISQEAVTISLGGKESDRMVPTSLGERVNEYIASIVPFLVDTKFTSHMEEDLDLVSVGKQKKKDLLDLFYTNFHKFVVDAIEEQKKNKPTKEEKQARKDAAPKSPQNVLKEFARVKANVVQTRFGPAIFALEDQRFVSLTPFLRWKEKTLEDLTEKDVKFLLSMPLKFEGTTREVHLGRYGLYVKDGDQNIRLPKELWDDAMTGELKVKDVTSLVYVPPKKTWTKASEASKKVNAKDESVEAAVSKKKVVVKKKV